MRRLAKMIIMELFETFSEKIKEKEGPLESILIDGKVFNAPVKDSGGFIQKQIEKEDKACRDQVWGLWGFGKPPKPKKSKKTSHHLK